MLEIIKVQKRSDILQQFSQFDAKIQSWLVSDLRTKLEIQNHLLEKDKFFVESSILRATDLWRVLFRRQFPKKNIIERGWARILLSSFLKKNLGDLNLNQASASTILEMIEFFLPLLSHPEGHEKFKEWLELHPEIKDRWAEWYVLTRLCFQYLYHEKDLVLSSWFSALLIRQGELPDLLAQHWKRPLWVDLGGQILWSEAELLRLLALQIDVKVFMVESPWQKDFSYKLRPSQHLENHATKTSVLAQTLRQKSKVVRVQKFSGELAEIRQTVGQIRLWLEEGIRPSEIGLFAPDIEKYWPVLKSFFDQEGIPVNKETTSKLASFPRIQEWLAGIRLKFKEIRTSDLELHFFQQEEKSLNYEDFKSMFANIMSFEDLKKNSKLETLYLGPLKISKTPNREEWVVFIARLWGQDRDTKSLAVILKELYANGSVQTELPVSDWLDHLESLVARLEISVESADVEGVHIASLMAAPSFWIRKRIFLGLSEDSLKPTSSQFLSRFEVEKLFSDLGFFLENHDLSSKEFELRMLADTDSEEDIFSFALVTLSGQLQAPSGTWLKWDTEKAIVRAPLKTRWDELQQSQPADILERERSFSTDQALRVGERLQMDQSLKNFKKFISPEKPSLSASRVETFLDCPFKFAAQALFELKDLPELDLHIDPRNYGNLVHTLFEQLTAEPQRWDYLPSEIENILQKIYENNFAKVFHPKLWPAYKNRLVVTAQRFIEFEKNWRLRFPKTSIVGREKKWNYEIWEDGGVLKSRKTEKKPSEKPKDKFLLSGKIDRVDSDGAGHLVVLDYKSGAASAENFPYWQEKNKLQLLFYIWALENDVMETNEVVGAFYFVFKTMERHRGLGLREAGGELFPVDGRSGALTDMSSKKKLIEDLEKSLISVMSQIDEGLFPPQPRDEDLCTTCQWKRLCRAPHLN